MSCPDGSGQDDLCVRTAYPNQPRQARALALLAGLATAATTTTTPAQSPWTAEQMSADLDEIAAAVRRQWSYFDDHREHFGVDVDALLAAAKAALPDVRATDDFADVVRAFAAGLQDGHAWSHVPGETQPPRRLPFELADCVEGLVVTAVAKDLARPRTGDVLVAIDGTEADACCAAAERQVFGSTAGMRRRLAIRRMLRGAQAERRCAFVDPSDGQRFEVTLATIAGDTGDGGVPEPRGPRPDNWTLSWPRDGVALLHLASFQVPRWQEWLKAEPAAREPFLAEGRARIEAIVTELNDKHGRALILDLRGNTGGTDSLGIHLAERLLPVPFVYFRLSSQADGRWSEPGGLTHGEGEPARFAGQVVAVVDELSFSTTDNFVRCLDDLHPAFTVVGQPTGGGTGAPRKLVEAKHSKAVVGACTMRVYGPHGQIIEGRGTVPDVTVRWTRGDWLAGRDPDLEAAFAAIAR